MISAITPATVSAARLSASLALIAILVLFALLIQKELTSAAPGDRARALGRALDVALVPLLIAFVFIAAVRVMEVLR